MEAKKDNIAHSKEIHSEILDSVITPRMEQVMSLVLNGTGINKYQRAADGTIERRIEIDNRARVLTQIGNEMNIRLKREHTYSLDDLNVDTIIELDKKANQEGRPIITIFNNPNLVYPVSIQFIPEVRLTGNQEGLVSLNSDNISKELIQEQTCLVNIAPINEKPLYTTANNMLTIVSAFMNSWETINERYETIRTHSNIPNYTISVAHPFFHRNTNINYIQSLSYLGNLASIANRIFQYGPKIVQKELYFDLKANVLDAKLREGQTVFPIKSKQLFISGDSMETKATLGLAEFVTNTQYMLQNILTPKNIPNETITSVSSLESNVEKVSLFIEDFRKNLPMLDEI
jgi:hypothetical protein